MIDKGPISGIPLSELQSNPPTGKCKVKNLYVDPTTGKLVIEYDDVPQE